MVGGKIEVRVSNQFGSCHPYITGARLWMYNMR